MRPAASPAPPATISPAQVFGQFDPEPAQGGVRQWSPQPWSRRTGTPTAPPVCHRRGEGQVYPAGAFPAAAVSKKPSELVNVSLCTKPARYSGCWGPICPAAPIAARLSTLPGDGATRGRLNPSFAGAVITGHRGCFGDGAALRELRESSLVEKTKQEERWGE